MVLDSLFIPSSPDFYVNLVWLFVLVITFLVLFLCYLHRSMRAAEERESQSLAFSHAAIAGLETERRRISRDLHDSVLPQIHDEAVSNIIRLVCLDLMPPDFSRISLRTALAEACGKFSKRTNIECEYFLEEELDFSWLKPENQLHIFRFVQEALTNIEKHAQASRAVVIVRRNNKIPAKSILVFVTDDGKGFDKSETLPGFDSADKGTGLGIRTMRQRAAILGATIDFISEAGNGLTVRMEIPQNGNT
jgi:two-component system NarL family sensor kinase